MVKCDAKVQRDLAVILRFVRLVILVLTVHLLVLPGFQSLKPQIVWSTGSLPLLGDLSLLDDLKPWGTLDLWELLKLLLLVAELRSTIILIKFELETLLFLQLRGAAEGILSGES